MEDRLIYDNETNSIKVFIEIADNKLELSVGAYDGDGVMYERVNDD